LPTPIAEAKQKGEAKFGEDYPKFRRNLDRGPGHRGGRRARRLGFACTRSWSRDNPAATRFG
jgi:hypothetical protein